MKKILLGLVGLILLSGCSATYNLKIEEDTFTESIKANIDKDILDEYEDGYYYFDEDFKQNAFYTLDNKNYNNPEENIDIKTENSNNKIKFNTKYEYSKDNFDNAYLLNYCFDIHKFTTTDEYYELAIKAPFNCLYSLDKIDLVITTDYDVIATNAKRENNNYTWTITKDNMDDAYLYIKILKNEAKNNFLSGFKITAIVIFLCLILIALFIYKKILNKNN